ncbi:hypothetical protein KKC1_00900 [Calderihabitans maritimus]|uniref:Uncharacterized protein n=1 Tax=Calderihabitans maritimus TaxID=1246530 RepID=A0A1Z5HN91_9FIRM|nr:hypothetical protein KKC1_00900 [Calderihabitans maritimus]
MQSLVVQYGKIGKEKEEFWQKRRIEKKEKVRVNFFCTKC